MTKVCAPATENSRHPRSVIIDLVNNYGTDLDFEFSYYIYERNTVSDQRKTFKVSGDYINDGFLTSLCKETPPGTNLALHSIVHLHEGGIRHIPMIDLAAKSVGIIKKILDVIPSDLAAKMLWFESGRSFHGYGVTLITPESWIHLMGLLLLANQPQQQPVVDPRWIGHRLLGGFSALRWTNNTDDYLQEPTLIKRPYLISKSNS